jgi:acyl-CoA oxidase
MSCSFLHLKGKQMISRRTNGFLCAGLTLLLEHMHKLVSGWCASLLWLSVFILELGHGSNVRGLETTATFDKTTDEFVIHTPTLSAIKWWPGNMSKTANHAIVMAQLIIDGKKYGVHGFIVQLREFGTHKVRPGIEVGDIGPKFGINMVDNGFLKLDKVRVPRENMLMRFAKVDANGTFSKASHSKLAYGTMVFVRATIVDTCYKYIARAATIAVRYSVVRRQFPAGKGQPEVQILDYQTQQHKLFPLVAAAYAMFFVGKEMMRLYHLNNQKLQNDDVSLLPELHALTSGWKALDTEIACAGIEIARKSLGGHGYMVFSGGNSSCVLCSLIIDV